MSLYNKPTYKELLAQVVAMRKTLEYIAGGAWINGGIHRANYSELMAVRTAKESLYAHNAGKALLEQVVVVREALERLLRAYTGLSHIAGWPSAEFDEAEFDCRPAVCKARAALYAPGAGLPAERIRHGRR